MIPRTKYWSSTPPLSVRFWRKVRQTDGCWLWTGLTVAGYGILKNKGRAVMAHRVSWELHFGAPGRLQVCHHCDNPPCVNPAHLFLGTQADNNRDRHAKGRTVMPHQRTGK